MGRLIAVLLLSLAGHAAASPDAWIRGLDTGATTPAGVALSADAGGAWLAVSSRGDVSLEGRTLAGLGGDDILLVRLGGSGRAEWAGLCGGDGDDAPVDLAPAPGGGVYLASRTGNGARFGALSLPGLGRTESAISRWSTEGGCAWVHKVPGHGEEGARSIASEEAGALVVAGTFLREFSRGDVPDVYVLKLGPEGSRRWMRRAEGTGVSLSIAVGAGGQIYLAGSTPSGQGPAAARYGTEGWPLVTAYDSGGAFSWRWAPEGRGGQDAWGRAVAVCPAEGGGAWVLGEVRGLVRVGTVQLASLRDRDLFLARLPGDGSGARIGRAGGPHDDGAGRAVSLTAGQEGEGCAVTGTFRGGATFPPWTVSARGAQDAFVAAYDAFGSCRWILTVPGDGADPPVLFPSADPAGGVWVAGSTAGPVQLGHLTLASGKALAFVARVRAGGSTR